MRFERELRAWSESDLAERVRRLAAYLGQPDAEVTAELVSGWESGIALSPAHLGLWCVVLDVPISDVLALLDPLELPEWVVLVAHLAGRLESSEMQRRDFLRLAAGGALTVYQPALAEAVARLGRPDRELVRDLAVYGERLAQQWDSMPPTLLAAMLGHHLETVKTLLAGPLAPGLRRDLMAVGAHAASMLGLAARFVGDEDQARVRLQLARQLASSAGDTGLEALALLWTADTLSAVQHGGEAITEHRHVLALLDHAEDLSGPGAPPALRAHVLLRQAEERAATGDPAEAERYLDRADAAVSDAQTPDLYGLGWPADQLHRAFRGNVELLSGRPAAALAVLADALARLPEEATSNRAAVVTDMGAAHARLGDVEQAAALLLEAWAIAHRAGLSDRRQRVLGVRRRDLSRWGREPAVRRLDEALATR